VFARQPCYPIPPVRDVGQWLCVPPFRVVCLYQAFTLAVKDAPFTRMRQRRYGTEGAAMRALGTPDRALHERALTGGILPACLRAISIRQATCQHPSHGGGQLAGQACTRRQADDLDARG
jgi:hypothetical protein